MLPRTDAGIFGPAARMAGWTDHLNDTPRSPMNATPLLLAVTLLSACATPPPAPVTPPPLPETPQSRCLNTTAKLASFYTIGITLIDPCLKGDRFACSVFGTYLDREYQPDATDRVIRCVKTGTLSANHPLVITALREGKAFSAKLKKLRRRP